MQPEQRRATGRAGEREPLERKDMVLFRGDWEALGELLAATPVKRTQFIRILVRRTIRRIQAARAGMERPVEDIDERLVSGLEQHSATTELATEGGQPRQLRTDLV